MKYRFFLILCFCLGVVFLYNVRSAKLSVPEAKDNSKSLEIHEKEYFNMKILTNVISQLHYSPKPIDDAFSEHVYDRFIKQIDPTKQFLYQSDIDKISRYKHLIDDKIKGLDLKIFHNVHKILNKRIVEAQQMVDSLLEIPFDFSVDETYLLEPDKRKYVQSKEDMTALWRKKIKYSALSTYRGLLTDQSDLADSLQKPTDTLEVEARDITRKSIQESFTSLLELERSDWLHGYLNAITMEFDPHTNYIPAEDIDEFDMSISGKLEGIGAVLERKDGYIKVVRLISGGPAWKAGELEGTDKILGVRQDDEKAPTSIIGMKLSKAVDLIKGPKGTTVHLRIQKVDGNIKTISIVRDVVELEEAYVKSLKTRYNKKKWGIIKLPKFYIDFDKMDARNCASDMKEALIKMNKQGIEGVVVDLRGNGGGSLKMAVEVTGLFIDKGPVVQIKSKKLESLEDKDPKVYWDKPLVILIDESSASASEIFAAAIQDYERGVILGSKQSHGKGTVQTLIELDNIARNTKKFFPKGAGSVKLTTQKFYRINGQSTQLNGVNSDVAMLDRYSYINTGERDLDNPLSCDALQPLIYKKWKSKNLKKAIKNGQNRVKKLAQMKHMKEWATLIKEKVDTVSLSYEKYDKQIKYREDQYEKYDSLTKDFSDKLSFDPLTTFNKNSAVDSINIERLNRWGEKLEDDIYVKEAINILTDLVE